MGRDLIARVSKTCGHRQADSGRIKLPSETVKNPDPDSFRPQNQRSRTQNPQQTRPQPPVERGWADKADSRPPLRGPGGWGGDWYVWHAPDGLRARAATGLGCMQACAGKLYVESGTGTIEYVESGTGTIDKMGSFGLCFGYATDSEGSSWWNGFSRLESRRGANAVVRESGRLPSIRAGFAGYS